MSVKSCFWIRAFQPSYILCGLTDRRARRTKALGSSSRRSRRPECIEMAQTPFHYRSEHVAQADLPQDFHNLTNQANYLFKCVSISRTYPEGHWQKLEKGRLEDFCYWHFPLCRCLWTVTERLWTMGCHWLRGGLFRQIRIFFEHCSKGGGSNPCSKNMLQILYDFKGLLAT